VERGIRKKGRLDKKGSARRKMKGKFHKESISGKKMKKKKGKKGKKGKKSKIKKQKEKEKNGKKGKKGKEVRHQ